MCVSVCLRVCVCVCTCVGAPCRGWDSVSNLTWWGWRGLGEEMEEDEEVIDTGEKQRERSRSKN